VLTSFSLLDCLGRVLRVKAKPLRGRFASLDAEVTARGMAAIEEDGEEQATGDTCGQGQDRRAISVPLAPVTRGLS
jgi:hypothetical protein